MKITGADLEKRYVEMTAKAVCLCEAATPLVGGVTAKEQGVRAFIRHHLKIEDPKEAEEAFARILREELGQRDIAPETGEIKEQLTYGINVIRRTAIGPYLGNWMIHANIKQSMSRVGIFVEMRGTKGNVSEGGVVKPYGISKLDDRLDCVYLIGPDGKPAVTYFEEIKGKVSTGGQSNSIVNHAECVPAGTLFEFAFHYLRGKLKDNDIIDALAVAMIGGIGSCRSLGYGKFKILEAEIVEAVNERKSTPKKPKNGKEAVEASEAAVA